MTAKAPPIKSRWWQRWDALIARKSVLHHWRKIDNPDIRRDPLYSVVRREVSRLGTAKVSLLDHGCGTGEDAKRLCSLVDAYTGADITDGMLNDARRRHPSLTFVKDDVLHSRLSSGTADIVVNNAVLPHLPPDMVNLAISELWRLAKEVLIVRVFGVVPREGREKSKVGLDGFIYNRWWEISWVAHLELCQPAKIITDGQDNDGASDTRIFTLRR